MAHGNVFRHRTLTVAGTFWPLHRGHKHLIDAAFQDGLEVFIGLTSDRMIKKIKDLSGIPAYGTRKKNLFSYLSEKGYDDRAHVFRIEDEYGFAADFPNLQAITVTEETLPNAKKINQRRKQRSMAPLDILEVDLVKAEDGKPISSSRIREGEIDPEGRIRNEG